MIEFYRHTQQGLQQLAKPQSKCWINLFLPTEEELRHLGELIELPQNTIHDLRDVDEIPFIEENARYTFLIIKAPCSNKQKKLEYTTVPIGIFVLRDMVITVSFYENDIINALKEERFAYRKTHIVFHLMLLCSKMYLTYLQDIKRKMYALEARLEETLDNALVMHLLELEKDLVYFETSLKSNEILIDRLRKDGTQNKFIQIRGQQDRKLIEDVMDENRQAIDMAHIYSNILSNTLDAFASIISNNLNNVIKVLTSITIVVAIPTLIASIYGMNVQLPYAHSEHAFLLVMILSFAVSAIAVLFLWRRRLI